MLRHELPPGYQRSAASRRPTLDDYIGVIDEILRTDKAVIKKQRHTANRIFEFIRDEHGYKGIRRKTRKHFSTEENIHIVLAGLRGEESIAFLCWQEGISECLYYGRSKEFIDAGNMWAFDAQRPRLFIQSISNKLRDEIVKRGLCNPHFI